MEWRLLRMSKSHQYSGWSNNIEYSHVKIKPSKYNVDSNLFVPGSKSMTNRALIIAALADGKSEIAGILKSDDSYWCIEALRELGVKIDLVDDKAYVEGMNGKWAKKNSQLFIGAAGTVGRFLPGALAQAAIGEWEVYADEQLSKRPIKDIVNYLNTLGGEVSFLNMDGHFPLKVKGRGLQGGEIVASGKISSQFISGVLIASPYAKEKTTIKIVDEVVQISYIKITLNMMEQFGASLQYDEHLTKIIVNNKPYISQNIVLESDISTACYFFALAALTGGKVVVNNVNCNTLQPDLKFLDFLKEMGCGVDILHTQQQVEVRGPKQLKGGFTFNFKEISDQALTIGILSVFSTSPITITGVAHIRRHESNRIMALSTNLKNIGIKVEENEDGFTVYPGAPTDGIINPYNDHRVAMAFALLGSVIPNIVIENPSCVSKTCPEFFEILSKTGIDVQYIREGDM